MEREQFVRENPEIAQKQNQEWNKWTLRIIAIVSLGAAAICATYRYCNDGELQLGANDHPENLYYDTSR